ncbi:MAG TPA: TRIC cation channel family protein, partial [Bacteroidales bacterium]|nr:TRIC cation channel family protein [Bacteroidales bacterium]
MTDSIISILDFTGTFAFAVSGALAAAEKKFDLFGAVFLGFVTAIGGGTMRD